MIRGNKNKKNFQVLLRGEIVEAITDLRALTGDNWGMIISKLITEACTNRSVKVKEFLGQQYVKDFLSKAPDIQADLFNEGQGRSMLRSDIVYDKFVKIYPEYFLTEDFIEQSRMAEEIKREEDRLYIKQNRRKK